MTLGALASGLTVITTKLLEPVWKAHKPNINIDFLERTVNSFSSKITELLATPADWDRWRQHKYIEANFGAKQVSKQFYQEALRVHLGNSSL